MAGKKTESRKPQITFQVSDGLKRLYELALERGGFSGPRLCAAGLLYLLQHQGPRHQALRELVEFETGKAATPAGAAEYVEWLLARQIVPDEAESGRSDAAAAAQAGDEAQRGPQQSRRRTAGK